MKRALVSLALILSIAVAAYPQFFGDAMAAAGLAELEGEFTPGMGIILETSENSSNLQESPSSSSPPRPSQNVSIPQGSVPVYQPAPSGPSPLPPSPSDITTPQPSVPAPVAPPIVAPAGVGYTISGGGRLYSAEDIEDWREAFVPVGTNVSSLSSGCEAIQSDLRYCKGVFYRQKGQAWTVIPGPSGVHVNDRPAGAALIVHRNIPYSYYNGTFFVWNTNENRADVVRAPAGIVVTSIPETAQKRDRNGQPCYVYGETTFCASFRGTSLVYRVV